MSDDLRIGPTVTIPAGELVWTAVRAAGPGGQNVNKVSTKIDLRWNLTGSTVLSPKVKARIQAAAGTRLDADGWLVITSQETRSQLRNLEDARARLAELIRHALVEPKRRRATKPTFGSKQRRLQAKRRNSAIKQGRGRVGADD